MLDLLPQILRRSLVTGLELARASLTPRLAEASASQSLPSQRRRYGLATVSIAIAAAAWAGPISVAELQYRPSTDPDEEYIELINTDASPYNLGGCRFTAGVTYTFGSSVLGPGERIVVCRDRAKFAARYGNIPNLAPSSYSGRLADEGETVTLVAADGSVLFEAAYRPDGAWPSRANGLGSSLEVVDPNGNLADPVNWRSSTEYLGSPGRAGVGPLRRVVVNEVLAHTDPPLEDAIELKNLTSQPIDVGGWYISNTRSKPTKYRIPSPTVVPAGGYRVLYEYQFNPFSPTGGDSPFTFNSANGDEAVLMAADANGTPQYWMDVVSFGPSENGVSFGRWPDGTGPLVTLSDLSLGTSVRRFDSPFRLGEFRTGTGQSNGLPKVGPLVFTRIQYRPALGGDEFVEVANATAFPVPSFDPMYPENTWRLRDAIDFDFPRDVILEPGERVLIVPLAPDVFRAKYSIPATTRVWGPYTNQLSNSGERLALFKPDPPQLPPHPDAGLVPYILVEEINYLPTPPWPVAANGNGPALRRIDPSRYGNDPSNWGTDADTTSVPGLSMAWNGGELLLRWTAEATTTLLVESATAPTGPWAEAVAVASGQGEWAVKPDGLARFYRLRRR